MILDLNNIDLESLIQDSITIENRTNLFLDMRRLLSERIHSELEAHGIEIGASKISDSTNLLGKDFKELTPIESPNGMFLDLGFCARYGPDFYSLGAINYQFGLFSQYFSLQTFKQNKNFSLGNIVVPLRTKDFEFTVRESEQIKIVGYTVDNGPKKRKPFVSLIGIHFDHSSIIRMMDTLLNKFGNSPILDEVCFTTMSYPIMFTCRKSGDLFSCTCFEDQIDWKEDFYRFAKNLEFNHFLKRKVENLKFMEGICHLCTNTTPQLDYGSTMYYSSFLVKFLPYYHLMNKKRHGNIFFFDGLENRLTENELRAKFGYYKIGEKWTTETLLYKMTKEIFNHTEVEFHYRGDELEGLELDIWIPKYRLGIEYQGVQHFKAIEHWGGTENLERQKTNDIRKKMICKNLGYELIEFFYDEEITKDLILRKLLKAGVLE